ncbi:amiloride-sensitive sodium channel subunit alpha [Biomphalaria pfeifferi]|uniref:Amiloride-sensitive sodium channel subunit alpha n=1 Tax=Biomphalaria pfeifferi TaxID=112525 RepID=A0AAD8BIR8_BIOPF|nr:amiloride-sensitive sodium channel subunit alpha [Biomphalaria pfeifferi]
MKSRANVNLSCKLDEVQPKRSESKVIMTGFTRGTSTQELRKEMYDPSADVCDGTEASVTTCDSVSGTSRAPSLPRGFTMIFYKYGSRASLNGVPFIMQSRNVTVKFMWSVLLAAAIGASIFHLYYLFSSYYEYQKYSQVNLKFDSLEFPAVTLCNVNMMRMSQRNLASDEIQKLFQTYDKVNPSSGTFVSQITPTNDNSESDNPDSDLSDSHLDFLVKRSSESSDDPSEEPDMSDPLLLQWVRDKQQALCEHCNYCWDQGQLKNTSLYEVDDYFKYLFNKQSLKRREILGHQLSGMIRMCSFAGRMCGHELFKRVVSPQYGNCYTLEHKDFVSRKSGPTGGLEIIISLETDEYTPAITPGVGARVIVHEPGTAPFFDDNDMAVSPGMHTFIALKKVEIERIGDPYSSCTPETTQINGYKYTKPACQNECEQKHIIEKCNCYDSELALSYNTNLSQCKKKDRMCLYKVRCELEANKNACDCKSLCRESTYEKTIATLQWPTESYVDYIRPEICNLTSPPDICKQNESKKAFRDELVKLNIYYEDLNYEVLTDQPNYQMSNLLSDIGGSIGLWIGLSVLSLFELLHLVLELIRYFTWRKWRKRVEKRKREALAAIQAKSDLPKD